MSLIRDEWEDAQQEDFSWFQEENIGFTAVLCHFTDGPGRFCGKCFWSLSFLASERQKTLDETVDRLNKMEQLRSSAQGSLENLLEAVH